MSSAIVARVQRIVEEIRGVKAQYGVNEWEWGFLQSMLARSPESLTERQQKVLDGIEAKVFR